MDKAEVLEKLTHAVQKLTERDLELLAGDVNERSITHRLAMYLQDEFPEMDVDCEYNRYGGVPKRVKEVHLGPTTTDDTDARTVFPDIIVHKRGPNGPNVLVIEQKSRQIKMVASTSRN